MRMVTERKRGRAPIRTVQSRTAREHTNAALKENPSLSRKVLLASHSHPQLTKGGAEIAAYELFRGFGSLQGYETWFLGCVRDQINQRLGATISQPFDKSEYIYSVGAFDWFKF